MFTKNSNTCTIYPFNSLDNFIFIGQSHETRLGAIFVPNHHNNRNTVSQHIFLKKSNFMSCFCLQMSKKAYVRDLVSGVYHSEENSQVINLIYNIFLILKYV